MKRRMSALFAALGLTAMLLAGCGTTNTTTTDGVTNNGSAVVDRNGDGIVGNDGYTGSADDGVYDSGTVTGDVGSAVEDIGRAAENGAEDIADVVRGDYTDGTTNNTVTHNGSTVTENGINTTTTTGGTTNNP